VLLENHGARVASADWMRIKVVFLVSHQARSRGDGLEAVCSTSTRIVILNDGRRFESKIGRFRTRPSNSRFEKTRRRLICLL